MNQMKYFLGGNSLLILFGVLLCLDLASVGCQHNILYQCQNSYSTLKRRQE
eukprot:m.110563 g.110563  ORF g.110563 m.110563 type:complete len:51 (+) comp37405_c0_seq11:900-1052(+)